MIELSQHERTKATWPLLLIAGAVFCLGGAIWGLSGLNHHLIVAIDKWGDAATAGKVVALDADRNSQRIANEIVRPCKGPGEDPNSCGLLADVKKIAIDTKRMVVTTQLQVAQTDDLVRSVAGAVKQTADQATDTIRKTGNATEQIGNAAEATGKTILAAKPAIEKIPAIEDKAGAAMDRFNALLNRPAIETLEDNGARLSASAASIADTTDKVAKKATHGYLNPSTNPWVRTGHAVQPYAPLGVKTLFCVIVPNSCL